MEIGLIKYQGCGNDYFVLDPNRQQAGLTERRIRKICDRNFGFGADGILIGPVFNGDGPFVRILNPDGSEAEQGGNGAQIFARYLKDAGYVQKRCTVIHTLSGDADIRYLDEAGRKIRTNMGHAEFNSTKIPVEGPEREILNEEMLFGGKKYTASCVAVGNPHCVIPVKELSRERMEKIGAAAGNASYFPNRINVQLLNVLDRKNLQIEVYERGAGYTLSSGTSACAAAAVSYRLGLSEAAVSVHMPGGRMEVELMEDGEIHLVSEVERIGRVIWEEDD